MTATIDFYFDFSSPYAYFGAEKIEDLAASFDRQVIWHPILLGAVFKETGSQPLVSYPLKGDYAKKDLQRLGRFMDIPFSLPDPFPIAATAASRAFYWLQDHDPDQAKAFALAVYRAYFRDGHNIAELPVLVTIGDSLGIDTSAMTDAIIKPEIKQRLRDEIEQAIARGVFGAPFFIIDGEPFWGADRFWMMKRWMKTGGW